MKKIIDLIDNSNLFDIEIEYTKKFSKNDIYFKQFLIKNIRGERNVSIYNCNTWFICRGNKKFN